MTAAAPSVIEKIAVDHGIRPPLTLRNRFRKGVGQSEDLCRSRGDLKQHIAGSKPGSRGGSKIAKTKWNI
ncbi:hypothetical protein RGCCGE502_18235 [Rhizobium grahamii CCGE 502]|uniref:Uncharacterized protein n=1 Tax=Rhizobium grahamii CCGE 502 TaxID=990285 RepID=S3HDU0_9HYPH|nr:hypothetical protein RGCCGE502_18235 [Rhizobium grahamii CCGE 502]